MRELRAIDEDLAAERQWWQREVRRTGSHRHTDVQAAARRLDLLLDERSDVLQALQSASSGPVDARLVQ